MLLLLAFAVAAVSTIATGWRGRAFAQPPGPESFAKPPKTPMELWEAVDYLVRTDQAAKAVPYLKEFQKAAPNDETMVAVRNRFGPGSFLRLSDHAETRPFAQPLIEALSSAVRRYIARPDRIAVFVDQLTRTPAEQDYAVRRLREVGPFAVPLFVDELRKPGLSPEARRSLVRNLGRLGASTIPALAAVLEGPEPSMAAVAATALGEIGERSAVPLLTFLAAWNGDGSSAEARAAAQGAIERLTSVPFARQPRSPARVLAAAAWAEHRHKLDFPHEPLTVWNWDAARRAPAPGEMPEIEATTRRGLRFAREALRLKPGDRDARVAELSLSLEQSARKAGGPDAVAVKDADTWKSALAAGPDVLGRVVETAIDDGKPDLAAVAVAALAKTTNRAALATPDGRPHPIVRALASPGAAPQFAAARGLVELAPDRPFPGSSQVAPALARFLLNQAAPRAVVIDGNPNRGGLYTGYLRDLGYHPVLEQMGDHGFLAAAEAADVELIIVSYDLFLGAWRLTDTLANLQADARTANVPLFVSAPYNERYLRPNLVENFPGIHWIVPPDSEATLRRELELAGLGPLRTREERLARARDAAALLAQIAARPDGPLAAGLARVEPELALALVVPDTAGSAAAALGRIAAPSAQRDLCRLLLDPSRPEDLRIETAAHLVRSVRQFGPLVDKFQERQLAQIIGQEPSARVRAGVHAALEALRSSTAAKTKTRARVKAQIDAPARR